MSKSKPRSRSMHSPEYKRFIEMLRAERKKLGLTQRALSEKLGQHHTYINLVERNARQINVIECRQIILELRLSFPNFMRDLDAELTRMGDEDAQPLPAPTESEAARTSADS